MQKYTRTLIEEETNLNALIEQAIKQNLQEDASESNDSDEIIFDDIEEVEKEITDNDLMDFNNFLEENELDDEAILKSLGVE